MCNEIKGIENVKSVMGEWSPSYLVCILSIDLSSNDEGSGMNLVMKALFQRPTGDGWPDFDKKMTPVTITFYDVRDLHLKEFGGNAVQIMGFDIHDVGDRGMENLRYTVEDYEDDRIGFNCNDIIVRCEN